MSLQQLGCCTMLHPMLERPPLVVVLFVNPSNLNPIARYYLRQKRFHHHRKDVVSSDEQAIETPSR